MSIAITFHIEEINGVLHIKREVRTTTRTPSETKMEDTIQKIVKVVIECSVGMITPENKN